MKMDRLFAGMVACVAGFALSAGSAFATEGYVTGDPAPAKVIPYYEVGGSLSTIIGVQNLSPRQADTPDNVTEYTIVAVTVQNMAGDLLVPLRDEICLATNQFGFVILQEREAMPGQETGVRGIVLSMMDSDVDLRIPQSGFVTLRSNPQKFQSCDQIADNAIGGDDTDEEDIAAWTVMQDVGTGFFGTEIPTVTVDIAAGTGATRGELAEEAAGLMDHDDVAVARFDTSAVNQVFVWKTRSEPDNPNTAADETRQIQISVRCEEGAMTSDDDANTVLPFVNVPIPDMVTIIDPTMMGDLGDATGACRGTRGTLAFTLLGVTHVNMTTGTGTDSTVEADGMVWTHISQRQENFRLNAPGYSMDP